MLQISVQGLQTFVKWLFGIFVLLFFLNVLANVIGLMTGHFSLYGILDLFEFHKERNFPTYFSSVTLLFASMLLFLIYRFYRQRASSDSQYWLALAIIFLLLSIDDLVSVHEMLNESLNTSFVLAGFSDRIWVIPAIIVCVILAAYFIRFYLRLPRRYQWLFGLSALLLIGGSVVLEIVDGYLNASANSPPWLLFISFTVKESMEAVGVLVFLYSLLDYIKANMLGGPPGLPEAGQTG
jgi:hypothetical protein